MSDSTAGKNESLEDARPILEASCGFKPLGYVFRFLEGRRFSLVIEMDTALKYAALLTGYQELSQDVMDCKAQVVRDEEFPGEEASLCFLLKRRIGSSV